MNNDLMFSSNRSDWGTPRDLFMHLNDKFQFNLDPAAADDNFVCYDYFTQGMNGLAISWEGKRVFVNPPYGREHNKVWAEKIASEGKRTLVVALLPARTGSSWFQDFITTANILYFLRGRLKFVGADSGAPFDSCIAIWNQTNTREIKFTNWRDI
jgi:site-specific DNA-methyltransferase (adenine-specific)